MISILRFCRVAAVVLLMSCGVPLCAEAQDFVCWPIASGETAAGLALRLTGTAETAYSDLFQIRDPARRTFVPKSQYARLSPGWHVCVARELVRRSSAAAATPARATVSAPTAASAGVLSATWSSPPTVSRREVVFAVTVGAGVSLLLLMISTVSGYAAATPAPPALQRAGEEFLMAFALPLIDPTSPVPPIAGKLRFLRRKKRLEICIAPNGGRRYPNLADHKENVLYDVQRVLEIMGTHRLVCDRLHAEREWVVVSVRLADSKEAGLK